MNSLKKCYRSFIKDLTHISRSSGYGLEVSSEVKLDLYIPELKDAIFFLCIGAVLVFAGIILPWIGPIVSGLGFFIGLLSLYYYSCFHTSNFLVDIARIELHKVYGGLIFLSIPACLAAIVGGVLAAFMGVST